MGGGDKHLLGISDVEMQLLQRTAQLRQFHIDIGTIITQMTIAGVDMKLMKMGEAKGNGTITFPTSLSLLSLRQAKNTNNSRQGQNEVNSTVTRGPETNNGRCRNILQNIAQRLRRKIQQTKGAHNTIYDRPMLQRDTNERTIRQETNDRGHEKQTGTDCCYCLRMDPGRGIPDHDGQIPMTHDHLRDSRVGVDNETKAD